MPDTVIKIENLWKQYRYGVVSHQYLFKDVQSWWAKIRGKEDPNARISSVTPVSAPDSKSPDANADRFWALKDINLEVKQGEILSVIGRNGAGKSTLLKVLSRVTAPTKGSVKVKGRIGSLLEVGTGFHPELTGRENIFLNGAILGMRKNEIKKKFDEIVAFAEVEKFIDTPVKRYSSGMYVRLAFSVAAHLDPEILVVDEVLAVGDIEFQKKCLGKMGDVSRNEGRTVLFVSHNMGAILRLCNEAIYLKDGFLAHNADCEAIVSKYVNDSYNHTGLSLNEIKNRKGTGQIIATNIKIYPQNDKNRKGLLAGESVSVEIEYQQQTEILLKNISVAIGIDDMTNNRIVTLWSKFGNTYFSNLSLNGKFICEIPELCLRSGGYLLHVYIDSNGILSDYIHNAFTFIIEHGNFYSKGIEPTGDQGHVLMKHHWRISG